MCYMLLTTSALCPRVVAVSDVILLYMYTGIVDVCVYFPEGIVYRQYELSVCLEDQASKVHMYKTFFL
jgi:hypothetical protein